MYVMNFEILKYQTVVNQIPIIILNYIKSSVFYNKKIIPFTYVYRNILL